MGLGARISQILTRVERLRVRLDLELLDDLRQHECQQLPHSLGRGARCARLHATDVRRQELSREGSIGWRSGRDSWDP